MQGVDLFCLSIKEKKGILMIKMLVCDFDGTLDGGSSHGVNQLSDYLADQTDIRFIIATGRTLPSIRVGLASNNYPKPHSIISDVGTRIHHNHSQLPDHIWHNQLEASWNKSKVELALASLNFMGERLENHQGDYKITFEGKLSEPQQTLIGLSLKSHGLDVHLTYSHDWYLDITPKGVNKATAIRHLLKQHDLSVEEVCVAGDSANDTSMLTIEGVNSILVANHYPEVAHLSDRENVYTSTATHAAGVLEGLKYWQKRASVNKHL